MAVVREAAERWWQWWWVLLTVKDMMGSACCQSVGGRGKNNSEDGSGENLVGDGGCQLR